MKKLLALIALSAAATPALAVERPYVGVDYTLMNYEFDLTTGSTEYEVNAVKLRFGSMLTRSWGLEATVGLGAGTDSQETIPGNPATTVDVNLEWSYSVSGVYRLNMGRGGLFAYAGYAYVNTDMAMAATSPAWVSMDEEEDGFTYGVGLDFPAFWGNNIEVDYNVVLDEDNYTQTGLNIGLRRFF